MINCRHYEAGKCNLATQLAGAECPTSDGACMACLNSHEPSSPNYVLATLIARAPAIVFTDELRKKVLEMSKIGHPMMPRALSVETRNGPGTELKKLFSRVGLKQSENCKCSKHAREMDERGCDWCEQHIDKILGWIKLEAKKQGKLFIKPVVRQVVKLAIRRARKHERDSA